MNRELWKTVLAVNILECIDIWFEIWITPVLVFLVYFHAFGAATLWPIHLINLSSLLAYFYTHD